MSMRARKPDDPFTALQLLDLARALSRQSELAVELGKTTALNWTGKRLVIADRKATQDQEQRFRAQIGDVLLFAYTAYQWGDMPGLSAALQAPYAGRFPRFYRQMVNMFELARLEKLCIRNRGGAGLFLEVRRSLLIPAMQTACVAHGQRREWAEAWLLAAYLNIWHVACPNIHYQHIFGEEDFLFWQQTWLPQMRQWTEHRGNAFLQEELAAYCQSWESRLRYDCREGYFDWLLPTQAGVEPQDVLFGASAGSEGGGSASSGEFSRPAEREQTHHEENTTAPSKASREEQSQSALQDEASEWRESDANVDHTASDASAGAGASNREEGWQGRWNKRKGRLSGDGGKTRSRMIIAPGEVNRFARAVIVPIAAPTVEEEQSYARISEQVYAYRKGIQRTISMTLDRQRSGARDDLLMGRLGKRLIRAVIDDHPRLFYKKTEPINRLDCSFHLLVDCSASMYDKMEETKLGIALFHESLRALQIHHAITGFWEDARHVTEEDYPNCFQTVIDYATSLRESSGPAMMQLQPQQDNRDGFAIRWAARRLHKRPERQRILLVFSDGEPAAAGYHGAGLLDSRQAVLQTRKMGMEVIGIYLATRPIKDSERQMMHYIYGRSAILVPNVEQLPNQLTPVLKKLLLGHTQASWGMGRI